MKKISIGLLMISVGVLGMLQGCSAPDLGPQVSLDEANMRVYPLDAKDIEFHTRYEGLTTDMYVNELMLMVENWARSHFAPVNQKGRAVVQFDEVHAQDVAFNKKSGLSNLFTTEQAGKLEASIALKITIQDDSGFTRKYLEVRANRSQTYPENATVAEKEKIWRSVVNALINALNAKLNTAMQG